ncbi:patatin-like phospholipase family protein [Amycolatopsis sp. cmx-4-68]|uniref:patatin-like phospholipase family protein n=1 Tax=Amycolatopsis sp. cmx-4-68 TaxID=2790938 RepID=UPI0039799CE5
MTAQENGSPTRTVVLGGGGTVGVAWQAGLLAGLRAADVDLAAASSIVGTSAGSLVGALLAGGRDVTDALAVLAALGQKLDFGTGSVDRAHGRRRRSPCPCCSYCTSCRSSGCVHRPHGRSSSSGPGLVGQVLAPRVDQQTRNCVVSPCRASGLPSGPGSKLIRV